MTDKNTQPESGRKVAKPLYELFMRSLKNIFCHDMSEMNR